jgi:hypothetical protein
LRDGVPDDDRCPAVTETVNGFNDTNGCPDDLPKNLARTLKRAGREPGAISGEGPHEGHEEADEGEQDWGGDS